HVVTVAAAEHVVAAVAQHAITARSAVSDVGSVVRAAQHVVAHAAVEAVAGPAATEQFVITSIAVKYVRPGPTVQVLVIVAAGELVVARLAEGRVVPGPAVDLVAAFVGAVD